MTVKSVQLELFTLSLGQLYLKLKYDIANIRLLQIHVIKIHLGYAIMMSIYTSIIITLLCIHSKHRVLTFTRKWCVTIHISYCINIILSLRFSAFLCGKLVHLDKVKDLSYMYMYLSGKLYIIFLKSITLIQHWIQKTSRREKTY